jgi:hypothetical protein
VRRILLGSAMTLAVMFVSTVAIAQDGAIQREREFFGYSFTLDEAKNVASRINAGEAPGWKDAIFNESAHPVNKTFGVYAFRFDPRLGKKKASLAVTVTWNTATDVDLWVTEPSGEKCFFAHTKTKTGGTLHEDNTTGYGPEHYTTAKMAKGEYLIQVNMYSTGKKAVHPTIVTVNVTRDAGGPNEQYSTYTVRLRRAGETIEVARIR